jgi:hypothetical protein
VYLTEQPPTSLRESLRRADLLDRDDFVLLTYRDCASLPWADVVASAVAECNRRSAGLLVVDTLSRFAGIRGDGENDAGHADAAMAPLQVAAAGGLAVIVTRHERKAGGEVGESARGSTAFGGAVDIILSLRRVNAGPNVRAVHALSRFDETPDLLAIELTDGGYVAVGDAVALAQRQASDALATTLPAAPDLAVTMKELQEALGASRTTLQRSLEALVAAGIASRLGTGRKNDPYRWWMPSTDSGRPARWIHPWLDPDDEGYVVGTA